MIDSVSQETSLYYPNDGWVEQNAMEIWDSIVFVVKELLLKDSVQRDEIAAIGITNQRETVVVWDKLTGEPVAPAISWQCRRTADICEELKHSGWESKIRKKTGLLVDAYFSATKLQWILDHVPKAREKAEAGQLLFGTIDTWLIWKLTNGAVYVTDYSNASRTMLFNIHTLTWDEELLDLFSIPEQMLPVVKPSSMVYGKTAMELFGREIPVGGAAGDQQAALFGQMCFDKGDVKNTYGTGAFLLMNTGEKAAYSKHGLLTTIAWGLGDKVYYALEGSVFVAGAAIQWLRDELQLIETAEESEKLAESIKDTNGVYLVPAFVGLGAPYWNPYARGVLCGLTRGTTKAHVVRAALEAIAYQTCEVLELMEKEVCVDIRKLQVDGGASRNGFLMQFQADLLNAAIERPACIETTALGAAYLAGLSCGIYKSLGELKEKQSVEKVFMPLMDKVVREDKRIGWKKAVKRSL